MFEKLKMKITRRLSPFIPLQRGTVSTYKICFQFIIGASFLLLPSCEFEVPDLSIQERKYADSTYRETMKTYRAEMDSLCVSMQDSLIPIYRDSMYKIRSEEIERQLERVRNSNQK